MSSGIDADITISDPADKIPAFGLSDEWLTAIGAVVVQWSFLEWILTSHLRTLLHQPKARHLAPTHLRISFVDRLRLYRKLAPMFYTGDALKLARTGAKIAAAVKDDREWLVHGIAIQERDGHLLIFRSGEMKTNKTTDMDQKFTRRRVLAAADLMRDGRLCLLHAYVSVSDALVPPWCPVDQS